MIGLTKVYFKKKDDCNEYFVLDHNHKPIGEILFSGYWQEFLFHPYEDTCYSIDGLTSIVESIRNLNEK